jgi:hypothetical protein
MMPNDLNCDAPGGNDIRPRGRDILIAFVASFGAIFSAGVFSGFATAVRNHGGAISAIDAAIGLALLGVTLGCAYLAWQKGKSALGFVGHVPTRERRSRNMFLGFVLIGVIIALVFIWVNGGDTGARALLSSAPVNPVLAAALALFWLFVLPVAAWYWHYTVDEHENGAFRDGCVAGAYAYMIVAPAWWMLWRGGLAPAPDGVVIYSLFNFTILGVWLWKKYR